jgi:hypothetical protein
VCESQTAQRQHCAADTSSGVVLAKSTGPAACLLGKTWGYDDKGVWVTDGCGGGRAILHTTLGDGSVVDGAGIGAPP